MTILAWINRVKVFRSTFIVLRQFNEVDSLANNRVILIKARNIYKARSQLNPLTLNFGEKIRIGNRNVESELNELISGLRDKILHINGSEFSDSISHCQNQGNHKKLTFSDIQSIEEELSQILDHTEVRQFKNLCQIFRDFKNSKKNETIDEFKVYVRMIERAFEKARSSDNSGRFLQCLKIWLLKYDFTCLIKNASNKDFLVYYLNILIDSKQFDLAYELWKSRTEIDFENDREWQESGVKLNLQKFDMYTSLNLTARLESELGGISDETYVSVLAKLCSINGAFSVTLYKRLLENYISQYSERAHNQARCLLRVARAFFNADETDLGFQVLQDYQNFGFKSSLGMVLMLVDHLSYKEVSAALKVTKNVRKQVFMKARDIKRLVRIFEQAVEDAPEVLNYSEFYRIILCRFQALDLLEYMIPILKLMIKNKVRIESIHMQAIMRALLFRNMYDHADCLLGLTEEVYNKKFEGVFKEYPISPVVAHHYNAFIQYNLRRQRKCEAENLQRRMEQNNISPNTAICNTMLNSAFHECLYQKAWQIYYKMSEGGHLLAPDRTTYEIMWRIMYRYQRGHSANADQLKVDPPQALEILKNMAVDHPWWVPGIDVYMYALKSVFYSGDILLAICIMEMCGIRQKLVIQPDIINGIISRLTVYILRHSKDYCEFKPAVRRSDVPLPAESLSREEYLTAIISGDLLQVSISRQHRWTIHWEDLVHVVYLWYIRAEKAKSQNEINYELTTLRKNLNLQIEEGIPEYILASPASL
ncbi:hypothetical protein V1514DRAFT_357482 [Lipomyces japonicus]|uniref:uncharacterized protein n=1 Tax=Lipomyces japonicus TaxID=56871 RepID=UPI0034CD5969